MADSQTFIEAARRKQIIDAAIETIAELGYGGASLAAIAKRAGISKGVISYHFDGKDGLIAALAEDVFARGEDIMFPAITAATTPKDKLRAYIESNIALLAAHRTGFIAIVEIFRGHRKRDGTPLFELEDAEGILFLLEEILRAGQQAGEFRTFDVRAMAISVRGAIDAIPPQMALHADIDLDAWAAEIADAFDRATRASG